MAPTYTPLDQDDAHLSSCSLCPDGTRVLREMEDEHTAWHQARGDAVPLPDYGGVNDVDPLPEKER